MSSTFDRRTALKQGLTAIAIGPSLLTMAKPLKAFAGVSAIGPLGPPDANDIRLPSGFTSRVVAASGARVSTETGRAEYRWHLSPDGGATFAAPDGGWVYVSNSETLSFLGGGVGAIRFDAAGRVVDAYRILGGTNLNCAGGPTPWGTWLSCEEVDRGRVYECDPLGQNGAIRRNALGYFKHEAAAVDPDAGVVYLTEDESDGRFYRFLIANYTAGTAPDLDRGTLQVAQVDGAGLVNWIDVPRPQPRWYQRRTRKQVSASTAFDGGEGCWYADGKVYFTTKGDNRVWSFDTAAQTLTVLYDAATAPNPILTGVDNVTVSPTGQVLVAEDGGDMQIVAIDTDGAVAPLLQVVGQNDSEITGPAFSPDGTRLYFSSQRGSPGGGGGLGVTYEVSGPFPQLLS